MAPTTRRPGMERLGEHLFGASATEPVGAEMAGWLTEPRFRAFAEAHQDKIRKKIRTAADAEALLDVRAELHVARLLLAERRLDLAFEAYGAQRGGPDFTLTYRTTQPLNLEVTRLRRRPDPPAVAGSLLTKLRQLPPGVPNAVLLSIGQERAEDVDIAAAAKLLRLRADAKEDAFFRERGFDGARAFYERFLRLGGVFVLTEATGADAAEMWTNRSARIPIPPRAARDILRALRGDAPSRRG